MPASWAFFYSTHIGFEFLVIAIQIHIYTEFRILYNASRIVRHFICDFRELLKGKLALTRSLIVYYGILYVNKLGIYI